MTITRVYIDGFNLFHGIIRENRYHWLDIQKFAERLNRNQPVARVIYCTAMVDGNPADPDKAVRQDIHHRALALACPNVEIIKGQFTSHRKLKPLAGCQLHPSCAVQVVIRSEKGSDVNLAARLLHDAHTNKYDRAIVVSGDSDLAEPIRLVTAEIGKIVWVRNPRNMDSAELQGVASDYAGIRASVLGDSQLPDRVAHGTLAYEKPAKWRVPPTAVTKNVVFDSPCTGTGCTKRIKTCRYI